MNIFNWIYKFIEMIIHMIIIHYVFVSKELVIKEIMNTVIKLSIISFVEGIIEGILGYIGTIILRIIGIVITEEITGRPVED